MFSAIEQAIIDRLQAMIPNVHVGALRELESVPELRQKAPAVWVIYNGYLTGDLVEPTGKVQKIILDWAVVAACKSAKGNGNTAAARDEASALSGQVLEALLGFDVSGGRGQYLRLSAASGPEYDGGYCHVPLAFTVGVTFKGKP